MMSYELTEDHRDCLQELANVSMGQASEKLARYLDALVHLSVPNISLLDAEEIPQSFADRYPDGEVTAISQGFFGEQGVRGEALLIYRAANIAKITEIMGYDEADVSEAESLIDISSVLTTTFLNGFAEQIENRFSFNMPKQISSRDSSVNASIQAMAQSWEHALVVDISYQVTDYAFNCDMFMLIPGEAVAHIFEALDKILDEW